jgi:hypothetical protein
MSFIGKSSSKSILRGPGRVLGFLEKGSPTLTWGNHEDPLTDRLPIYHEKLGN